jgi:hypothetical protein
MPRDGATTLSDVLSPTMTLACKACGRQGRFNVARLLAKHGDANLPDLRRFLSNDCPRHRTSDFTKQCQALFDPQPALKREKRIW